MQIVQFIVDLHLVYFGSELNVFDVSTHLMIPISSQPIPTLPVHIGLSSRHLVAAMERSPLLSLVARYSRAIFCSSSSSTLIHTRSRLATRSQLRMDRQLQTGMGLSNPMFDAGARLMALLISDSRKIEDTHREKVRANGNTGRWQGLSLHFYRYLIYHHG